ncbi:MAG TPA: hypothetical protein VGO36_09505 [Solirubrobacterales bacterium]|jgi:hypothetical protein|nr:hypothetical protein [Solirubrobacterales bacterium]
MKRIVRNEIAYGMALALPVCVVVALTGAGARATYLITVGFLALAIVWRRFNGSI